MTKAKIEVITSNGVTSRTTGGIGRNVVSVNHATRTVVLSAALDAGHAAGDLVYLFGTAVAGGNNPTYYQMPGLVKALNNTTDTIHGIDASDFDLWAGNQKTSIGAISHARIQEMVALAAGKGFTGTMCCLLSPKAWAELNSDQAALRMFDGSYSKAKAENGFRSLEFFSSNGSVEIIAHAMVKQG
jgi:hypothetical protein